MPETTMLRPLSLLMSAALAASACTADADVATSLQRQSAPASAPGAGSTPATAAGSRAEPDSLGWALVALTRAAEFEEAHLGVGGYVLSEKATAFRIVLRASDPTVRFREVLRAGTVAGQLYGLAGLRLTAPVEFEAKAARFTPRQDSVQYASGCEVWSERTENLLRTRDGQWDIAGGNLPRSLAGRTTAP